MPGNGGWDLSFGGTGTGGAVLTTDTPGAEPIDRTRNALILLGGLRHVVAMDRGDRRSLYGGASELTVADTYEDHPNYIDSFIIDWDKLKGDGANVWTVEVVVELRCQNASTTVTPRVVLAGTGTAAQTGTAHNTTSWGSQTLTIPSSSGVVTYRPQIKRSTLDHAVQAIFSGRIYKS